MKFSEKIFEKNLQYVTYVLGCEYYTVQTYFSDSKHKSIYLKPGFTVNLMESRCATVILAKSFASIKSQ
jgi:hypothetical protein